MATFPLNEWIPSETAGIKYTCDEAISAKLGSLNAYNSSLNKAIERGDTGSIALYKQLIKQTRVDIADIETMKRGQGSTR